MDVLLTDDDPDVLRSVRRVFERRGHRVSTCATGRSTLETLADRSYDLLVLDWELPDLDGIAIVTELRSRRLLLPVLMLTGRGEQADLVQALDAGADDFLSKSDAAPDVLMARCEALIRRARYATPLRVDAKGIVVDEATRAASVHGVPITLTTSELKLLVVVASAMGQIVPRAQVVAKCWGEGATVSHAALDSLVSRVRKKLGSESHRLQAIRLRGYVLTDPDAELPR